MRHLATLFCFVSISSAVMAADPPPALKWEAAAKVKGTLSAEETRTFMRKLAQYAFDHHLKQDAKSLQKGMLYEYFHVARKGEVDQWIQGEALDTMHDGSWFAAAMAHAYRATGDDFYRRFLVDWQMPFYLKMLNESDALFSSDRNDAKPDAKEIWKNSKEWLLQGREKGFVPYWWDDGASVSLEQLGKKLNGAFFPCTDDLAGKPNPRFQLSGYSHGSSNHLAQDLGVMLQTVWLLLKNSPDAKDQELAKQVALAARNLQECRVRHGAASIPAVIAAAGLTNNDGDLLKRIGADSWQAVASRRNHYQRALFDAKPDATYTMPGFADDDEYTYFSRLAQAGTLTPPTAFSLILNAYTHPMLFKMYCDDWEVPPGMNVFDLYPYKMMGGKPVDYRSQRKGPFNRPKPMGSRFGPQNMVVCGWALQALKTWPDLWREAEPTAKPDVLALLEKHSQAEVKASLERELGGGLRTWQAVFETYGYIPTAIGGNSVLPGVPWDALSDTGGYAHLISAASQWLFYLDGKKDWEVQFGK